MIYLIINFAFYFVTAIYLFMKEKGLTINVISFLYISIFAFAAIFVYDTEYYLWGDFNPYFNRINNKMSLTPHLFVFLGFLIYFSAIKNINSKKIKGLYLLHPLIEKIIYYVNIVVLLLVLVGYKDAIFQIADFSSAYAADGDDKTAQSAIGYLGMAGLIISTGLSVSQIILPFYLFAKGKKTDYLKGFILLILYFIANLLESAISGSRGRLFFTIVNIVFSFFIFKNLLSPKLKRGVLFLGSLIFILFAILAVIISQDRFGDTFLFAVASYFGEPFLDFSLIYWDIPKHYDGEILLSRMHLIDIPKNGDTIYFMTLPGFLYLDFGIIGALSILVFYAFFFKKAIGSESSVLRLDSLLLYIFYIEGISFGVFTFHVYGWSGYVILFLNYFMFKYSMSRKKVIIRC